MLGGPSVLVGLEVVLFCDGYFFLIIGRKEKGRRCTVFQRDTTTLATT